MKVRTGPLRFILVILLLNCFLPVVLSAPIITPIYGTEEQTEPSFSYTPKQTVKTHDPSINSSVYFDGANYIYTTPFGIYTWTQPGNLWSFTNFMGDEVIKQSFFILQYESWGSWLPLLEFKNKQVQSNDTFYEFSYDVFKKKDHVCSVAINFVSLGLFKPKISVNFIKTLAWDSTGLGDFRWIWDIIPSTEWKYWKNETLVDITAIDEELPIGNYTRVEFTDNSSQKIQSILDVSDYGAVDFNLGKTYWNSRGFVGVFPVNVADIDPMTYTEQIESFAIAADATWTDYNLTANKGVPKDAIAEIIVSNKNADFARIGGVRTDGSGLNRYIDIHEAEGGGVTTANMFVKVDESTGLIECYSEIQGDVDFYLLGYFEGIDFTESFTNLGQPDLTWIAKDLSGSGVPASAVVQIMMGSNATDADYFAGVREVGSALERGFILDEAETDGLTILSTVVKANASSTIEWKGGSATEVTMWLLGWFGSNVDFTEGFADYSPVDNNTWTIKVIIQMPIIENLVAVFALMHEDSGAETFCGLRRYLSALDRRIEEHEAEGGGSTGFQACVSPYAGWVEIYCEDASEALFSYMGYFSELVIQPTAIEQQKKVFKNPRGQGNYYALQEDEISDWDFHYSAGNGWTDSSVGVTCLPEKHPSLSIFEDDTNSRLVVVVVYIASDDNLDVQAFAIADGGVTIATLWTSDSVDTPTLEFYNPVICVDANGYVWITWTDRFYNTPYDRNKLRATRTTSTYPLTEPSWETNVNIYGELGSTDYPAGIIYSIGGLRSELVPLTATADVGVIFNYYEAVFKLKALNLDYSAGIQEGTVIQIEYSIDSAQLHSSVAESGANSDVFIGYKIFANDDFICRKWDISEDSSAEFGIIHSATDVDSLALSIDKNADPDMIYAFYVKTGVPGDIFYNTTEVDVASWSFGETIDDDSESIGWLSASYQDWNLDGDVQLIYTRLTSKTVGFWRSLVNNAPVNDAYSIKVRDDTNNVYAQKQDYSISQNVSDAQGYEDIDYAEARIKQTGNLRAVFRYDEDTDTFSIESGDTKWELNTGSCSATESGTTIIILYLFSAEWDADEESDVDLEFYVVDDEPESDNDTLTNYFDVVTNLLVSSIEYDDADNPDRDDVGGSGVLSVSVRYANDPSSSTATTFYPPDGEFTSVIIHDSTHSQVGIDTTIVNGDSGPTITISASIGSHNYHAYIDMADADYTDGDESPTETIISDQLNVVFSANTTTPNLNAWVEINWNITRLYDSSVVSSFSLDVDRNSTQWKYGCTNSSAYDISAIPIVYVYDANAVTDNTYGLTKFQQTSVMVTWLTIIQHVKTFIQAMFTVFFATIGFIFIFGIWRRRS